MERRLSNLISERLSERRGVQELQLLRSLRARELHVTAMEQLLGGDTEACSEEELDALDYVTGPSSAAAGEEDGADDEPGPSEAPDFQPPAPCSYLQAGQEFEGRQRVARMVNPQGEYWRVLVRIQELDRGRGLVAGSMWAENVPHAKSPVVTYWEGEVVDDANHSFFTAKWGANRTDDLRHWSKFQGFCTFRRQAQRGQGRWSTGNCGRLREWPYIFMRWKERFFVNVGEDCGLTIAGFYYVCLERASGRIEGFYFDPSSTPFQRLDLQASCPGAAPRCQSFGTFEYR